MRITSKGQVTIPIEIRERFGLLPNTAVSFETWGGVVRILTAPGQRGRVRGSELVARLKGTATARLSTDEILALTRE